jgi:hypothetical protein
LRAFRARLGELFADTLGDREGFRELAIAATELHRLSADGGLQRAGEGVAQTVDLEVQQDADDDDSEEAETAGEQQLTASARV